MIDAGVWTCKSHFFHVDPIFSFRIRPPRYRLVLALSHNRGMRAATRIAKLYLLIRARDRCGPSVRVDEIPPPTNLCGLHVARIEMTSRRSSRSRKLG